MFAVLHALELHGAVAGYLVPPPGGGLSMALGVPDPAPQAPPGLSGPVDTVLAWGKWGVLICGVAGLLVCGAKMAIGHKNRSTFAAEGASGVPWVLGGLSLAAVASAIVGVFLR
jgi:hypothetical protein